MTVKPKVFESIKPESFVLKPRRIHFVFPCFICFETKSEIAVPCGVINNWPVWNKANEKKISEGSLRRIVEEVLMQLILFSHWKCQEAAICGDSLVASMGVTQDDQVAP